MVNLFNIENKTVRDAMVPWSSALVLDKKLSAQEVEPHVIASGHTRIPVMEEGRVVGLLHTKEFIALAHSGYKEWQSIIRPHVALKGADSLIDSLRLMQEKRCHLGVVYEQEKPVGIITIEDILEEIVGDIYDEDDDGMIKKIIAGRAAFDAFNVQERDR
jgi:putative hemolysin